MSTLIGLVLVLGALGILVDGTFLISYSFVISDRKRLFTTPAFLLFAIGTLNCVSTFVKHLLIHSSSSFGHLPLFVLDDWFVHMSCGLCLWTVIDRWCSVRAQQSAQSTNQYWEMFLVLSVVLICAAGNSVSMVMSLDADSEEGYHFLELAHQLANWHTLCRTILAFSFVLVLIVLFIVFRKSVRVTQSRISDSEPTAPSVLIAQKAQKNLTEMVTALVLIGLLFVAVPRLALQLVIMAFSDTQILAEVIVFVDICQLLGALIQGVAILNIDFKVGEKLKVKLCGSNNERAVPAHRRSSRAWASAEPSQQKQNGDRRPSRAWVSAEGANVSEQGNGSSMATAPADNINKLGSRKWKH